MESELLSWIREKRIGGICVNDSIIRINFKKLILPIFFNVLDFFLFYFYLLRHTPWETERAFTVYIGNGNVIATKEPL